jgi:hypothetical protein
VLSIASTSSDPGTTLVPAAPSAIFSMSSNDPMAVR